MSDHADIIRDALKWAPLKLDALAALDALVAERDEARRKVTDVLSQMDVAAQLLEAVVSERDEALAANEGKANLILHEALLARVTELEAERRAWEFAATAEGQHANEADARVLAAEAEVARLREALAEYREKQRQCALDPYVQARRTHDNVTFHDGYYNGRIGAVTDLDSRLLSLHPTKEDTDE